MIGVIRHLHLQRSFGENDMLHPGDPTLMHEVLDLLKAAQLKVNTSSPVACVHLSEGVHGV